MWKPLVLLICLHGVVTVLAEDKTTQDTAPEKEPPTTHEEGELDETMDGLGWCKEDREAAGICIQCAQLPGFIALPPGECCTDEDALVICKNCVENPIRCLQDKIDIAQGNGDRILHEEGTQLPLLDKRFGMLFMGQRSLFDNDYTEAEKRFGTLNLGSPRKRSNSDAESEVMDKRWGSLGLNKRYGSDSEKRWGSLGLRKRSGSDLDKRWGSLGLSKRFGTLGMGSYFNKRYGMLGMGNPYLGYLSKGYGNMDKRFGTLNMGGGRNGFRKRYGTLHMDKKWGTLNMANKRDWVSEADLDKRYGTLNLGKRYGTLGMGNRYSAPSLGKRYGTLNMGSLYGFYPHKREEYVPYNGNIGIDMRKRYGRLFMGRLGGKRLGSTNEIRISEIKK